MMRKSIALLTIGMGLVAALASAGCDPNPGGPSAPSLPQDGAGGAGDASKKAPPALPLQ